MIRYLDIVGGPGTGKTEAALAYAVAASRHGRVLFIASTQGLAEVMYDRAREVAGATGWLEPVAFVGAERFDRTMTQRFSTIVCDCAAHLSPGQHERLRDYVQSCAAALPEVWVVNAIDRVFYEAVRAATLPKGHLSAYAEPEVLATA